MDDGHCGLPAEELIPLTQQLLEVPTELVETVLSLELQKDAVIADDLEGRRCVFLAGLYRAEREIAEKLKVLDIGKPPRPSIDNGIDPPRPKARNTRPSHPADDPHYPMLRRNRVYAGGTRGKRLVVLVWQRKALAIAIKGGREQRRWSKLREWLSRQ